MTLYRHIQAGTTDVSVRIRITDDSTGAPETGVTAATAGLDLKYHREKSANVDITEINLSALTDAHSDGGLYEIGNGYYRLDLPDAACASGSNTVLIHGTATGMIVEGPQIDLVHYDPYQSGAATSLATKTQVAGVGVSSGGARSFAPEADNVSGAIKSVSFVGVQTSGTYASVSAEDGTIHILDDTGNAIDIVYQYDVGEDRTAVSVTFKGYINGQNDDITLQAWNGTTWVTRAMLNGQTGQTNISKEVALLGNNTDVDGKVYIRLVCTGMTNPTLGVDQMLVQAVDAITTANVQYVNGTEVTGSGTTADPWGP